MIADAEQGSGSSLGFLNPLLYSLSGSTAITDVLGQGNKTNPLYRSDPTCGSPTACAGSALDAQFEYQKPIETVQVTQRGYDTMTGLGTPNGQAFISALPP